MPKLNSKILIIIAGVVLILLIAVTIFVSGLTKKSQTSQTQPTLIPTGIFESRDSFQGGNSQDKEEQEEPIMSEEEVNRLQELKNKAPIDSSDFTIGYSPDLGEFFVSTKTPQGEEAFRQYMASNQLTNILANFSDLFNIGAQSLDQLIRERENEIANQDQRLEQQLAEQQKRQITPQQQEKKSEKQQQIERDRRMLKSFSEFAGSLFTFSTGGSSSLSDLIESALTPTQTPTDTGGGGGSDGGGGGGGLPDPQPYTGQGTPQLKQIMSVVRAIAGLTWGGICVTSGHIAGSQHYFCNAVDIFGSETLLDNSALGFIAAGKNNELPINCVIYERFIYKKSGNFSKEVYECTPTPYGDPCHDNHIHISGWPSEGGTGTC